MICFDRMAATTNGDFGEIGFQAEEEAAFGDVIDAALQDETPGLNSMGDAAGEAKDEFDDPKGEDLMEQDEQVIFLILMIFLCLVSLNNIGQIQLIR